MTYPRLKKNFSNFTKRMQREMNNSEKEMMKIIKKNNKLQNKTKMVLKM
jgi:uncharacterized protein YeaO (DUF488 family)